jgi:hypothetical protein
MALNIIKKSMSKIKISGRIIRIAPSGGGGTYLWVRCTWETPYLCKCKENLVKIIKTDDYIEIHGIWKKGPDPIHHHEGPYLEFYTYKVTTPPTPLTTAPKIEKPQKQAHSLPVQKSLAGIHLFMKKIGEHQVYYRFHESMETDTIARHVRYQLMERVIQAIPSQKDLYFLTAFFDASALDYQVQSFRKKTPDFKEVLINCWKEADLILTTATHDIPKYSKKNFEFENSTLKELCYAAPGRFKQKYLLICFKIVNDKYERSLQKTILDIIANYTDEQKLRNYLIDMWGVDYKLANWALTNVTGHWFVIDMQIEKAISTYLRNTIAGIKISAANADLIFRNWFGNFNEKEKNYSNLSQKQFVNVFPDFSPNECEYLPFIVTQYLWFYGKFVMAKSSETIVPTPKIPQQINQADNISKIKAGLLAPVKNSYLERAVRDIYPVHGKVSFGSDKKTEMIGIQKYVERNRNVSVYLFYQGYTRYKAILINEFYFYADPKPHPKPWGSWNLPFKSYYTVTDIKEFVVPITDFMFFNNKKKVEYPPYRPLWIIDVL